MRTGLRSLFVAGVVAGLPVPMPSPALAQSNQGQGPVPMPLQVQLTPAPGGPVVTWQPMANATSYTLRRWKRTGNQGRCCEKEVRAISGARYVDTLVAEPGVFIYRIVAHLRDGRRGFQERTIQVNATPVGSAPAENPRDFVARQTGAGTVSLHWSPVPRAAAYRLTGPATGANGLQVQGTSQVLTDLREGRWEWELVTHYPPGTNPNTRNPSRASVLVEAPRNQAAGGAEGTIAQPLPDDLARRAPPGGRVLAAAPDPAPSAPAAEPQPSSGPSNSPPVAVAPPSRERRPAPVFTAVNTGGAPEPASPAPTAATSARYLVSVVGLRAGRTTKDGIGIVDVDGKGDEIMAAAFVRRYSRATAEALEYTNLQTMVYGDIHGYQSERVQAGRLTSTGGITDGDPIPFDGPAARTLPAQTSVFPWRLWEGTLTDGADALVISPSVWEYDGNPQDFFPWAQNQQALNRTLFLSARLQEQIDAKSFGPLVLGANETTTNRFDATAKFLLEGGIGAVMGLPPLGAILGRQRDRPIGIVARDQNTTALPNTTVVLTREIIEAALATPARGVANPIPSILIPLVKPGIMVIDFQDKTLTSTNTPFDGFFDRAAFYSMILQVERVP